MVTQTLNMKPSFRIRGKRTFIPRAGLLASFLILVIMGFMMAPIAPDPNLVEAAGRVSSMDLTVSTTGAMLNIVPTSYDGTFATSTASERANISVATDNYTGYTLTIKGTDNTGNLTNSTTGATLASISSAVPASTFSNKDYKDTYNGKWGYKPSKLNSTTNTNYLPAPTTTATTLDVTTSSNPTTANSYTLDLGARVDYSNVAGSYNKTFILAAIGNQTPYTINYLDGSSTILAPTVGKVTGTTVSATVSSAIPTKTGYTFNGWCTKPVAADTACTGNTIAAGSTYNFIDQTSSINVLDLYAMWSAKLYNVTVKTVEGVSSVSLNGQSCTSTTGCTQQLKHGHTYPLSVSLDDGYRFEKWEIDDYSKGAFDPDSDGEWSATTSFTVYGASTIWPRVSFVGTTLTVHLDSGENDSDAYGRATVILQDSNFNTVGSIDIGRDTDDGCRATCDGSEWSGTISGLAFNTTYYIKVIPYDDDNYVGWDTVWSSPQNMTTASLYDPTTKVVFTGGAASITVYVSEDYGSTSLQNFTHYNSYECYGYHRDSRDNQSYNIYSLADGNCWMMENLNLGSSDYPFKVSNLTSSNTNLTTSIATSTFNSWKKTSTSAFDYTYTSGELAPYRNDKAITMAYNYYAASAGTVSGLSNTTDTQKDICPKGWRMPTWSEIQTLYDAMGSSMSAMLSPNNNSATTGGFGSLWTFSSTAQDGYSRWAFESEYPNYADRNDPALIRCMQKPSTGLTGNMQDVNYTTANAATIGSISKLKDNRDNKYYNVKKIDNNNLVMIEPLGLGCNGSSTVALNNLNSNNTNSAGSLNYTSYSNSYTTPYVSCYNGVGEYNYYMATASTRPGGCNGSSGQHSTQCSDAAFDICPAGWRLPELGEQGVLGNAESWSSTFDTFDYTLLTGLWYQTGHGSDYESASGISRAPIRCVFKWD